MNLYVYIRGENGKPVPMPSAYHFEEDELDKLRNDFKNYCKSSGGVNSGGGSYKCKKSGENTIVFLKFDEIVFIC